MCKVLRLLPITWHLIVTVSPSTLDKWGKWGTRNWNNFRKVTQLINGSVGIQSQAVSAPTSVALTPFDASFDMYYIQILWAQFYYFYELSFKELTNNFTLKRTIAQTFWPLLSHFWLFMLVNKLVGPCRVLATLSSRVGEGEGRILWEQRCYWKLKVAKDFFCFLPV